MTKVEVLPIEQGATQDPSNVNKHSARGGTLLENSLRKRGAFRSIASAGKGVDIPVTYAGNYTLEKAVEAGFKEIVNVHVRGDQLVNVVRDDIEPGSAQAIALGLEDNESASKSYNPDIDILAALAAGDSAILSELRKEDKVFGGMLEGMGLKDETQDAEPEIDRAAELLEKWKVKTGDLWTIGEHRLLCGDSTKREDVERVMGGEKARMLFTDPPYGIGKEIINDNLKREDWINFYKAFTDQMLSFAETNSYIYVWGYFDGLSNYWQEIIKPRQDCNFRNFIVWKKHSIQGMKSLDFMQFPESYEACLLYIFGQPFQNGPWSTSPNAEFYPEIFEPIRAYLDGEREKMGWDVPTVKKLVGHSDLSRDHWFGKSQWTMPTREVYEAMQREAGKDAFRREYDDLRREYDDLRGYFDNSHGFTDVWEFSSLTTSADHPTVKPIEVCEHGVISTSAPGEIVLDVFLGSGSTMLACQNLGRKCRAIEIDPKYCAVTLERMATAFPELVIQRENKENG